MPYRPAHEVPFYLSWPAGGLGAGTTDSRITANIDIAPTVLDAAGITPTHSVDGRSLLSSFSRDHLLVEWWQQGATAGGPPTWASYVGQDKQYTEYYDLAGDPYQLTNKLYQATPAEERSRHAFLLHPRTR